MPSSLLTLQKKFSVKISEFILELDSLGYGVSFGEAYRPHEMAEIYAIQHKGIINSLHCDRLAIDLNIFKDGKLLVYPAELAFAGRLWEAYSEPDFACAWGGNFSIPDADHFSMPFGGRK